jgi:phenylpyruvate tautomerase PptA (4-oxalocrotonate tautomerase family)
MPSTRLETAAGWINGRYAQVIAAVQRALVEGLRIPEQDRDIRILEYPPQAFAPLPHMGPKASIIEISMIAGRSLDAKRRLYAALVRELAAFGLAEHDVKVLIHEPPLENWGIRGKPLADTGVSFKIDV